MDSTRNSVIMARPNRPRIYLNNSVHLTVFDLGIIRRRLSTDPGPSRNSGGVWRKHAHPSI